MRVTASSASGASASSKTISAPQSRAAAQALTGTAGLLVDLEVGLAPQQLAEGLAE